MTLNATQIKQLNDVVTETRITRGKNAGKRKDNSISIDHFDMRSFKSLITKKLVTTSEYSLNLWYATERGYDAWFENKQGK